ncbi:MAG: mechanosensitive ion channel [Bacteroidales bacterium]|nr:mechanosensitive ion channel [Bacteroidales bacterium]
MKYKHLLAAVLLLAAVCIPAPAVFHGDSLGKTINSLKNELKKDHEKRVATEASFETQYRSQRREMVNTMKKCNELSLMLYSQKQDYTFDITYAFQSVSDEYNSFKSRQLPYEQIISRLDWDIDSYSRLLESLRRLPPALERIDAIPDSLAYHNDSLDFKPGRYWNAQRAMQGGLAASMGLHQAADTASRPRPYILDEAEQLDRDTCIFFASEMLKMSVERKNRVIADSTYYHRTHLRLKESYDYSQEKYRVLQKRIFKQGQIPIYRIIPNIGVFWKGALADFREKVDNGRTPHVPASENEPLESLVLLIISILASLLLRLRGKALWRGLLLYLPLVFSAFFVMMLRIMFIPNIMMNIILPIVLLVAFVWQFTACLHHGSKVPSIDRVFGWITVVVTAFALAISCVGFIFAGLLDMVWWYFQVAAALGVVTVLHLLDLFRDKVLRKRIAEYRKSLSFLPAEERESMLFGVTWLYDLVRDVLVLVAAMASVLFCTRTALKIFDFSDLYTTVVFTPFVNLTDSSGAAVLTISLSGILTAVALFFVFRYLDKAIFHIFRNMRYSIYVRKNGRKAIRSNEINFSLGKSIISASVWFVYIVIILVMLKIPTSSVTIIAGGLSAGIGIAMKDLINNFVYGIQLMSGRVRVGDYIECDGVRGKVTSISYQSTQIETVEGAVMSFLNSSLFANNFRNLTRNHAYELLKIVVGVSYGTDVAKVRTVLLDAMEQLRTKDSYGRDIVDPKKDISITFDAFDESSVNVAVKQYVLVVERIAYSDRAREVIYNALNEAGITIPFPQRDIHVVNP